MINLRVFVPAQTVDEATVYEDQYRRLLGELCDIRTQTKGPYWKIPELYELFFRCTAKGEEYDAFLHMADRIGANPSLASDIEFIWSTHNDPETFVTIPETYWAHLELEENPHESAFE